MQSFRQYSWQRSIDNTYRKMVTIKIRKPSDRLYSENADLTKIPRLSYNINHEKYHEI